MTRKICRKCLLKDVDPDRVYLEIKEMIAAIPEDRKCGDEEYARRLELCRGCDSLGEGMCGECGCFVELRAAKKDMHCPSAVKKW